MKPVEVSQGGCSQQFPFLVVSGAEKPAGSLCSHRVMPGKLFHVDWTGVVHHSIICESLCVITFDLMIQFHCQDFNELRN